MLVKPLVRPIVRAIAGNPTASLGSGFSPTSLFLDGSKGVVYDNNDLSSFYLDSAGTTAATVNGLVGLQLDRSANLVLGVELAPATNSVSGWTPNANCTIATVGGELEITATAVGVCVADFNVSGTSAGKNYLLTAVCRQGQVGGSGASVSIAFGSVPYSLANTTTTNAAVRVVKIATIGAEILRIRFDSTVIGQKAYFSLLSFKELPGNHRYQATTGSKPVLRGTPTGSNLVTNGDFASGTGWTLGTGITISAGKLNFATADATPAAENVAQVVSGKVYKATFTISGFSAGGVSLANGVSSASVGGVYSANGTYEQYFTATQDGSIFIRARLGATTLSVDDFTLFDVSAGQVTAPYGLQYDGVDDFLQTASVNFSATDKMFVCAGVRKLSDAARAMFVELGNVPGTNTFRFEAPPSASPSYSLISGGSLTTFLQTASSFPAPVTNVATGIMDISGDSIRLRINASEQTPVSIDQGTGNYGNHVLYFGRRGGASLPLNGLDFGFVICGKTLTSTQIANTERWMSYRTGVTL